MLATQSLCQRINRYVDNTLCGLVKNLVLQEIHFGRIELRNFVFELWVLTKFQKPLPRTVNSVHRQSKYVQTLLMFAFMSQLHTKQKSKPHLSHNALWVVRIDFFIFKMYVLKQHPVSSVEDLKLTKVLYRLERGNILTLIF